MIKILEGEDKSPVPRTFSFRNPPSSPLSMIRANSLPAVRRRLILRQFSVFYRFLFRLKEELSLNFYGLPSTFRILCNRRSRLVRLRGPLNLNGFVDKRSNPAATTLRLIYDPQQFCCCRQARQVDLHCTLEDDEEISFGCEQLNREKAQMNIGFLTHWLIITMKVECPLMK
ncbi:hypothetical protein CSKR_111404 [Clonorchis sinensis]|uniref:Uncharacterized protein n=2 Tax=Clonorchis sinensis TaxID=79923 RepID=A0A8T1LWL0_CLOSI|nr:hypothetical protein CSKR_111404 [Clonorchis sinensis]GAA48813.1 hypothetical protein CLF_102067 [Clonorchis sinensis]